MSTYEDISVEEKIEIEKGMDDKSENIKKA